MIQFTITGQFPEIDIQDFAAYKGYQPIITVEVTPTTDPATYENVTNPQTATQFVEKFFLDCCTNEIADMVKKRQFKIKEATFLAEVSATNEAIVSNIQQAITVNSTIINP